MNQNLHVNIQWTISQLSFASVSKRGPVQNLCTRTRFETEAKDNLEMSYVFDTLVPEVFFRRKETSQERERSGERKPLVAGDANLTIMLR